MRRSTQSHFSILVIKVVLVQRLNMETGSFALVYRAKYPSTKNKSVSDMSSPSYSLHGIDHVPDTSLQPERTACSSKKTPKPFNSVALAGSDHHSRSSSVVDSFLSIVTIHPLTHARVLVHAFLLTNYAFTFRTYADSVSKSTTAS